ncbi:hypothetical protein SDC9_181275 [bioreactor metagenome]|uniref:Uncharacterized protein n=1 Tax=bioreactor metagenome TaxID=1076179 RepID=A0A645HDC7_9ZZZZ
MDDGAKTTRRPNQRVPPDTAEKARETKIANTGGTTVAYPIVPRPEHGFGAYLFFGTAERNCSKLGGEPI